MKTSSHLLNASRAYRRRRKAEANARAYEKAKGKSPKSKVQSPKPKVNWRALEDAMDREAAARLSWRCDGCGRTFEAPATGENGKSVVKVRRDGTLASERLRLGGRSYCADCAKARSKRRYVRDWAASPAATPWPAALRRTAR